MTKSKTFFNIHFLTKRCWNIVEKHRITAASETAAKVMWGHWPDKTPISACARTHTHTPHMAHTPIHSLALYHPRILRHIIDLTHLHLMSVMRIIHVNDSFRPKRCNTLLAFMVSWTTFIIHGTFPLHKIYSAKIDFLNALLHGTFTHESVPADSKDIITSIHWTQIGVILVSLTYYYC